MQVRHEDNPPTQFPSTILALVHYLDQRGHPPIVASYGGFLNQLLQTSVEDKHIDIVCDRGKWDVTMRTTQIAQAYTVGVWRAASTGTLGERDAEDYLVAHHTMFTPEDLQWLTAVLEGREYPTRSLRALEDAHDRSL